MQILLDSDGCPRIYNSVLSICHAFFECRRKVYQQRKAFLEQFMQAQYHRLAEKVRFIQMKVRNELHLDNKSRASIVKKLQKHQFMPDPMMRWVEQTKRQMCDESQIQDQLLCEEAVGNEIHHGGEKVPKTEYLRSN